MTLSGSSVYRAEDMREDDRDRDRSPLRPEEHCEYNQPDTKKQKLTFGFGKKAGSEQKKGIQIKLGSASVSFVSRTFMKLSSVDGLFYI